MSRLLGRGFVFLSVLLATLTLAGAVAYGGVKAPREVPTASHPGGSITVLEAQGFLGTWTGFDPAITTSQSFFEPTVYGGLFDLGPSMRRLFPTLPPRTSSPTGDSPSPLISATA